MKTGLHTQVNLDLTMPVAASAVHRQMLVHSAADYSGLLPRPLGESLHCARTARYFSTMFPPKSPQAHPLETPLELINSTGRLGPKRGQKCYVTPAFSGIPKQTGTKSEVKTFARGHHDAPKGPIVSQSMGL